MKTENNNHLFTDLEQISDILSRCDTMTLGMNDGDTPYLIPMTFAHAMENGQIVIYFHSAKGGHKWEILNQDPNVCIEAHIYYKTVQEGKRVTAKYESVIGSGKVEKIEERKDKAAAFKLVLAHYNQSGFPAQSCEGLSRCDVFKVPLTQVTGKNNL